MPPTATKGKLRIGDDWSAINIIALSQDNPLKAVAEFVENSIDAGARSITITRGRERGEHYLQIVDDGRGVPRDDEGAPDFRYVATHICDSIKRRLKRDGATGIQGEFGIGLLSFWTVGDELSMSCAGADGNVYEMRMQKGEQNYSVGRRHALFPEAGTKLKIRPLLPGIRQLSGDKIQWYLAAELRERIRQSGVRIKVVDRQARKELAVEPRQFSGQLLHQLPALSSAYGEIYAELYLNEPSAENCVGLYRSGTRILVSLTELDILQKSPWNDGYLQGIVDASFLNLTPATRAGVIQDAALQALADALLPLEQHVNALIAEQKRAEEERASQDTLRAIQRAFREAMLTLPSEEYDWFAVNVRQRGGGGANGEAGIGMGEDTAILGVSEPDPDSTPEPPRQKQFFEYAGPLYSVRIAPASCTLAVGATRSLRAVARDRARHHVENDVALEWRVLTGDGTLEGASGEFITFRAADVPSLVQIGVTARQGEVVCEAQALITVTDSILPAEERERGSTRPGQGLPGYTLEHAPGKLWRSRMDLEANVIVVNSGHKDFIYASRAKTLKLRYLVRLYAKEMVQRNFPGLPAEQLLERLIELSLYTEEHLR